MRIFAVFALLAALIGVGAALPAAADCQTQCYNSFGQRVCNTHCW